MTSRPKNDQARRTNETEPGMEVETTAGDLGERDVSRPHVERVIRDAFGDIAAGTTSGNLVAYFVIVSTAATLYTHHQQIASAADAARALAPLAGPFATELFAIGLIATAAIMAAAALLLIVGLTTRHG